MYATKVFRHVNALPDVVYEALLDQGAIPRWRVPDGMSAEVHEFDPREGGRFRISLTYDAPGETGKTAGRTDTYHGRFVKLVPGKLVVEQLEFESADPQLAGSMTMTTTLTPAADGTDVLLTHEGIPDAVPRAENEEGTRMALANLAAFVEGTTHSEG